MSMKDAMEKWMPRTKEDISVLRQTGLEMATDESPLAEGYVNLPGNVDIGHALVTQIAESITDEIHDRAKYAEMAASARNAGRPDIGLALDILSHEEGNHHEILEALLPGGGEYTAEQKIVEYVNGRGMRVKLVAKPRKSDYAESPSGEQAFIEDSEAWRRYNASEPDLMELAERMDSYKPGTHIDYTDVQAWLKDNGIVLPLFQVDILKEYVGARREV